MIKFIFPLVLVTHWTHVDKATAYHLIRNVKIYHKCWDFFFSSEKITKEKW